MAKMSNRGMTKKFLIQEMDRSVKRMLKLIQEEGDSFAKKAEIYYQKRPLLVSQVQDFYRMFRLLAERIENPAPGDVKRTPVPSELQSQGSGGISDVCSEPASRMHSPPDNRLTRRLSGTRPGGGFDFIRTKDGDENWMMESESDSDDSSVFNYSSASTYPNYRRLRKRINELEAELRRVQIEQEVNGVRSLQEELRFVKEKLRASEEQVGKLRLKLVEQYQSMAASQRPNDQDHKTSSVNNDSDRVYRSDQQENGDVSKLEAQILRYKASLTERDQEILKLRNQVTNLLKERAYRIKEWGLQHEMGMKKTEIEDEMGVKKTEMEDEIEELKIERDGLIAKVSDLEEEMSLKDDQIEHMNQRLRKLQSEHEKSSRSIEELGCRSRELERVIEKQQEMIEEAVEDKRQAVRQLCITLEHYRNAYQMLRQDLKEQKKPVRFRSSGAL
ncbi:hypothetical protein L6452_37886 [Arctium lappa]|uniref:Uncharacterized protein n=1 Tax=Arctium lappa TaxID=4217 RepID=A0ACB8Y479_ARCLA|nr:hypothetical protein L6452_37886 [Arctium lappa]